MIAGRTAASQEHMLRRRGGVSLIVRGTRRRKVSRPDCWERCPSIMHVCVFNIELLKLIQPHLLVRAAFLSLSVCCGPRLLNLGPFSAHGWAARAYSREAMRECWVSELLNRFFIICVYKSGGGAPRAFIGWPSRFEPRGSICIEIFIVCPHTHTLDDWCWDGNIIHVGNLYGATLILSDEHFQSFFLRGWVFSYFC